jgi:hypothetical protein
VRNVRLRSLFYGLNSATLKKNKITFDVVTALSRKIMRLRNTGIYTPPPHKKCYLSQKDKIVPVSKVGYDKNN